MEESKGIIEEDDATEKLEDETFEIETPVKKSTRREITKKKVRNIESDEIEEEFNAED